MSYSLVIKVVKFLYIKVGSLGFLSFRPGLYIYVGSAKKNFSSRIKRHLRKNKKKFWHIDYLLSKKDVKVKKIYSVNMDECLLAKKFLGYPNIKNFGSSDCKDKSHLFFINKGKGFKEIVDKNNLKKERISL